VKSLLAYCCFPDFYRVFFQLIIAGILSACTPHLPPSADLTSPQFPAEFPEPYYRKAEASGSNIQRIDTKKSLVTIIVRRGGTLARLGHDHVVASHDVTGYVDMTAGRADLYVLLDRLVVDESALRTEAGFTTQPSQGAIDGTRQNMLTKVLESDRFPFALISVKRSTTEPLKLSVTITLHGTRQMFEVPAKIESIAGGMRINGELSFNQSDFGITPFSILGGALLVQDHLDLHFRIMTAEKRTGY